jgi:hypothetical protein
MQLALPARMVVFVCMVLLRGCPGSARRRHPYRRRTCAQPSGSMKTPPPARIVVMVFMPAPQPQGSMVERQPARTVVVVFMASSLAPGVDEGPDAGANDGRGAHGLLPCSERDAERLRKCCLSIDLNERARGVVPSLGPGAAGEDNPLRRRDERSVERASAAGEGRRARVGVRG